MLIDTHAHINFEDYKYDADETIKRALENDIWLINVGVEFETSKRAVEYAEKYSQGVFAAVGFHPTHLSDQKTKEETGRFEVREEGFDYEKYKNLAQSSKVVAIGETGLDYYRIKNDESEIKEKQKIIFRKQIELAVELNKPLIIHCRNAHDDLIETISDFYVSGGFVSDRQPPISRPRGVIHSFSGNYKQARQYRELGFKIAFNGIITFSRDYDRVVLDTPLEDILLETDCPYLAPTPYRGQRNEPLYIVEVAKKIAEIKNFSLEEVVEQTTLNSKEVFRI